VTAATMTALHTTRSRQTRDDLCRVFRQNRTPIYFINPSPFNLFGAEKWIGNLTFVNTSDSFGGRHPNVFVTGRGRLQGLDLVVLNHVLLRDPATADFFRERDLFGKALFLMLDEESERLARGLGLEICLPRASLRHHLDSKIVTSRLATRAGVASVPHVLAPIGSYEALRAASRDLGPDLCRAVAPRRFGQDNVFHLDGGGLSPPPGGDCVGPGGKGHAANPLPAALRFYGRRDAVVIGPESMHYSFTKASGSRGSSASRSMGAGASTSSSG
jgi:hypothetical protein